MFVMKIIEGITMLLVCIVGFSVMFLMPLYVGSHYGGNYPLVIAGVIFLLEFGVVYAAVRD